MATTLAQLLKAMNNDVSSVPLADRIRGLFGETTTSPNYASDPSQRVDVPLPGVSVDNDRPIAVVGPDGQLRALTPALRNADQYIQTGSKFVPVADTSANARNPADRVIGGKLQRAETTYKPNLITVHNPDGSTQTYDAATQTFSAPKGGPAKDPTASTSGPNMLDVLSAPYVDPAISGMQSLNSMVAQQSPTLNALISSLPPSAQATEGAGMMQLASNLSELPGEMKTQLADLGNAGLLNDLLKAAQELAVYRQDYLGGYNTPTAAAQATTNNSALQNLYEQIANAQNQVFSSFGGTTPTTSGTTSTKASSSTPSNPFGG